MVARTRRKAREPKPPKKERPYLMVSEMCFENYFWLDEPGRLIAMDALAAGEITTPYEAIDMLCLANMMYMDVIHNQIASDLEALGSTIDYENAKKRGEVRRLMIEAIDVIGLDRFREIFREAPDVVRKQLQIPKSNEEWLPPFLRRHSG